MPRPRGSRTPRRPFYDPELLENWTLARLKAEATRLQIDYASNVRRPILIKQIREVSESGAVGDSPQPDQPTLSQDASQQQAAPLGRDT